jgi:hypothetical protein
MLQKSNAVAKINLDAKKIRFIFVLEIGNPKICTGLCFLNTNFSD